MKKFRFIIAIAEALTAAVSCGQGKDARKVLVLYYSQSANTKALAEEFAERLGADIEEVLPVERYAGAYQDVINRSSRERQEGVLPEVKPLKADIASYDLIFVGYPIWFGTYALPMASALESIDLNGKKVVPFCTFGSGGLEASAKDLQDKFPKAEVMPGYGVRAARMDAISAEVDRFLKSGGYIEGEAAVLEAFPEAHPVSEDESAIFDAAVGDYPMIQAKPAAVASRTVPGGTEYLFTALSQPIPGSAASSLPQMKVYVLAENGKAPVFTRVVR